MPNHLGPLPKPTLDDQGFWDACNNNRLVIQRCSDCHTLRHRPRPMCPHCRSMRYDWATVSGRGTLYSFSVVHHPLRESMRDHVPYVIALVELEEGPRLITNLVGTAPDHVRIGLPVHVFFDEVAPGIKLPRFRAI